MKKLGLLSMVLCVVTMCCVSCKSKQSAYKAAYEQAKEREMTNSEPVEEQITPVTKAKTSTATRQEKITPISGENPEGIKLYSVVIGSFKNKTNAYSLKERMQNEGYMPVLGENEQGMLRVILTSHETRKEAEKSRDAIRAKFFPNFQDAWLLERTY
ncbi:SPOR domain-containing protein [Tannerella forsythia]|jgi:Sporulation related domain.|nr:SPOR domain-containing protein [Tannerella forsythia]KKY61417.1 cell division protein [Tannerella forsythia]OLQ20404.1 cell division protein [Tannerella forsythia]PDP42796.1 SPOR domain-containing protein [Tannerella forsythia]PDP69860.1 SPOR domain-containing protein [Tannerella forsythia]TPE17660.1 SPOR domain-containing protein [Tannerella forsythia]